MMICQIVTAVTLWQIGNMISLPESNGNIFAVKWRSLLSWPCCGQRLPQKTLRNRNGGVDIDHPGAIEAAIG